MPMPATPSNQKPPGDDRNLVIVDENYVAPGMDDKLRLFWEKNSRVVVAVCALVILALVGRSAMQYFASQREATTRVDYGKAITTDQLKAFVAQYPEHRLAGLAELRLADEAYGTGNFTGAKTDYLKAATLLAGQPLVQRAQLGAAMARIQAGQTAEATAALKQLANDATLLKSIRLEAAYTLAVLASDAGRTEDQGAMLQLILSLEPQGMWAQRASLLQARPTVVAPAATPAAAPDKTPAIIFNPSPASK